MKDKIRKLFLQKRNSLSIEDVEEKSRKIISKLKKDKDYIKAKTVMFYVSKEKEVNTQEIIKEALKEKKVIVPKVIGKGIVCCELKEFDKMEFSCLGILEPKEVIKCDVSKIDLIIVPAVAFDKSSHRIGYGKGYYDELLKHAKAKKLGLAYDFQIVDKIPADEWDVKVDKVITD